MASADAERPGPAIFSNSSEPSSSFTAIPRRANGSPSGMASDRLSIAASIPRSYGGDTVVLRAEPEHIASASSSTPSEVLEETSTTGMPSMDSSFFL